MNKKTKLVGGISLLVILIISITTSHYYEKIYAENVTGNFELYLPSNVTLDELIEITAPLLRDSGAFEWVLNRKKYTKNIRSGKFSLTEGMNSNELINLLRSGKQTPVKLTFNNQHRLELLAGRISQQIEADSISLLNSFTNPTFLEKNGFTKETALGMYIPNSYQIYWNTSADSFRNRMLKEYNAFWNSNRISKAQKRDLSIEEVITLASIVQKETAHVQERPIVAGLYLNRFHKKWALQADPTVIFALKEKHGHDTVIKRVLFVDLKIESPYNTYKHIGIPPGPISMPDISSIDAVLNATDHDYFYMCVNIDNFGTHAFAKNLRQHNRNARKYQKWLSKQGVNR
jgi:UPF0755 protein